jgi:glycogen debranching enzyme
LIAALEPHETGMDQTPAFDAYIGVSGSDPVHFEAAWRAIAIEHAQLGHDPAAIFARDRFVVEEVASNVLYAENQRVLAGSLAELGDADGAAELGARADRTESALLSRCWVPDLADFCSLAGRAETPLPGSSVAGLMPILLRVLPEAIVERLAGRMADPADFGTRYPVPSVSRGDPAYRAAPRGNVLWRGQSWINMNWYLARGLRRHGREQLAWSIEDASLQLVEKSGFREHYNPETGVGYGAHGFGWSALVLDMLAERIEPDGSAG